MLILYILAHFCQAVEKASVMCSIIQSTLTNPAEQYRKYHLLFHKTLAHKVDHHSVRGMKLLPVQSKTLCASGESTHSHTGEKSSKATS